MNCFFSVRKASITPLLCPCALSSVTISTPTSCKAAALSNKSAVIPSGEETVQNNELLVYPNPVSDVLTISLDKQTGVEEIMIYSISGRLVRNIAVHQRLIEKQVDCKNLVPGTYMLKLTTGEGNYSMKFVKQ